MFVLRTLIEKYATAGSKLYSCFIDFGKAFDTILHSALLYKITNIGLSGKFFNILKSMYEANSLCVRTGNELSYDFSPSIGVRQGDNLSPNLFKLYVNDLVDIFDSDDDPVFLDNCPFSCMLYADDLILLSTSEKGLQSCLNKLATFCDNNGLNVNLNKTKVIIFNKGGKLVPRKLFYKGTEIQHSTSYKYLGIIFSASGSFTHCQEDLYKRGLRAYYKLLKCFDSSNPSINTYIHLFDHTIKPILLYGSEIWGTIKIPTLDINNFIPKLDCDKLHLKFLKFICGVNKRATNFAIFGELGRYPLYIDVIANCIKFYDRLRTSDENKLVNKAFKENATLEEHGKSSWLKNIHSYLNNFDISTTAKNAYFDVKKKLIAQFIGKWKAVLRENVSNQSGKLRTYALFKDIFEREKYLSVIKNYQVRKCFTKFRISAHSLEIEKGRHRNIEVIDRKCTLCDEGAIEDEIHFLFNCPHYEDRRRHFNSSISNPNYALLSQKDKLIWLMSNEDHDVIKMFSSFIYDCFEKRQSSCSNSCSN